MKKCMKSAITMSGLFYIILSQSIIAMHYASPSICEITDAQIRQLSLSESIDLLLHIKHSSSCSVTMVDEKQQIHDNSVKFSQIESYVRRDDNVHQLLTNETNTRKTSVVAKEGIVNSLLKFWQATTSDGWYDSTGWGEYETCYCDWIGVYCSPCDENDCKSGHCGVIGLSLPSNNLVGELSIVLETLSNLGDLTYLDLSYNGLSGTIPDTFNPTLEYLGLSNNNLEGPIPDFKEQPHLNSLLVENNFLDGNLPSFDGLALLSTFYVGDANIHGTLPSFLNNPYLNDVWIFATYIEGTIPLYPHLSLLQHLDVGYNNIQGSIPELHIPTLLYFDASDNNLEGGLPSFSNTSQLMFLSASQNFLESCEGLSILPHLHVLILFGNDISHGVPDLLKFPSLQLLDLYQNSMSGHISNLDSDSLLRFDLGDNYFSGTLPEKIRLPRVQLFDISYNSLSGSIPPTLGAQYSIQLLTLAGNQLSGLVPKVVWRLPNLKLVDLSSNYFSGDLGVFLSPSDEDDIFETARYIILILHSNFLTGCLDSSIFDYTSQVIQISLAGNYISCLGDLRYPAKWLSLDLNDNPIEGFVPDSWENFILLISFGVQRSQMQGYSPRFLPSWMNYSEPYHLIGDDENFICPSVWSVHHPGYSSMDLDPFYYKHVYCKCLPGFYGYGNICLRCPRDCTCPDGISVQDCFITPNITHAEKILLCPVMGSCEQNLPNDRELVLLGEDLSSCKKGYSDRLCSRCDIGYGAQGYRCEACNSISTTLLLIGLSVGFIGFIVYLARHRGSSSGKMKIIVFHGQIISIISVVLRKSRDIQQATSFSFSLGSFFLPSVSCIFGTNDAFTPLLFNMFRPLLLSIICSILYLITSKEARDKVVYVWIVLLHMMYYGIARDVFGVYGCTLYDDGTDTWYLNSYSWIACSPQSPEYKKMLALVTVVLFAYIIPFPYFVFKQIKSCIHDESSTSKKIRYGFLYSAFRPDQSMWELISIARRLIFAVVVSIVPYDVPSILFVFLFLTIQFSIWLQHQYHPYRTRGENWMEIISLYVIFFSFFLSLLSTLMSGQSWIHTTIMVSNIAMLSVFFIITLKGFLWKSNPTAMDTVNTYQFPAEDSPTARQVQVVEMNLHTEAEG